MPDSRLEGCLCNCHRIPELFPKPHDTCLECMVLLIAEANDLGWREALERVALWCEGRGAVYSAFYARSIRAMKR